MNYVAAKRKRQAVVLAPPPNAKVFADLQAFVTIGKLAFVDDEPDVGLAALYGCEDLVERYDDVVDLVRGPSEPELQSEKSAGHGAGNGDRAFEDFVSRECLFRDQHRPVAVAHAGAAGEQGVFVANVGVGVN